MFAGCNYFAMKKICLEKGLDDSMYDCKKLVCLFVIFMVFGFMFAALYPFIWVRLMLIIAGMIIVLCYKKRVINSLKIFSQEIKDE